MKCGGAKTRRFLESLNDHNIGTRIGAICIMYS
jgi:hypothetical protein